MECDLYVGKVTDEPDTWVLGTIKRVNTKFAVIQQRYEYPFAKCCGVGDFEVYTDSLIKVPTRVLAHDEVKEENEMLIQQVEALERDIMQLKKEIAIKDKAYQKACEILRDVNYKYYNTDCDFEQVFLDEAKEEIENDS